MNTKIKLSRKLGEDVLIEVYDQDGNKFERLYEASRYLTGTTQESNDHGVFGSHDNVSTFSTGKLSQSIDLETWNGVYTSLPRIAEAIKSNIKSVRDWVKSLPEYESMDVVLDE